MKTSNILNAKFSFDCFSNVCTFQDTFEGLYDVIFPTEAFLQKLVGIDVQQAEVTRKHTFKPILAILSRSYKSFYFSCCL